jgi:serralysin
LPTGEYTLLVSKSTGSGSYTLSANGTAISGAEMSVTINDLFTSAVFLLEEIFLDFRRLIFTPR